MGCKAAVGAKLEQDNRAAAATKRPQDLAGNRKDNCNRRRRIGKDKLAHGALPASATSVFTEINSAVNLASRNSDVFQLCIRHRLKPADGLSLIALMP